MKFELCDTLKKPHKFQKNQSKKLELNFFELDFLGSWVCESLTIKTSINFLWIRMQGLELKAKRNSGMVTKNIFGGYAIWNDQQSRDY